MRLLCAIPSQNPLTLRTEDHLSSLRFHEATDPTTFSVAVNTLPSSPAVRRVVNSALLKRDQAAAGEAQSLPDRSSGQALPIQRPVFAAIDGIIQASVRSQIER